MLLFAAADLRQQFFQVAYRFKLHIQVAVFIYGNVTAVVLRQRLCDVTMVASQVILKVA